MKYISFTIAAFALFSCSRQSAQPKKTRTHKHTAVIVTSDDGFRKYANQVTVPPPPGPEQTKTKKEDPFPLEMTPTQTFSINVNRDTTLVCNAGTKIYIPSYSMVDENTQQTVSGAVVLSVNEFYSKKDIFLAQLTTSSNGKMLESGGMVYLTAASGSQNCVLKTGKNVQVSFPYKDKKPSMQVFYGTRNENGMEWDTRATVKKETNMVTSVNKAEETDEIGPPPPVSDKVEYASYEVEEMAEFPGMNQFIQKNVKYPELAREMGISGRVYVQFTVYEDGTVHDVMIKRGIEKTLDAEAARVVKMMPAFKPARIGGKNVKCKMILPISFRIAGSDYNAPVDPNYKSMIEEKKTDSVQKEDINYYILSSAQLGWINCDRFYNVEEKAVLTVNESGTNVMVGMVFHSIRSYLRSTWENGKYVFKNIPANEKITLLLCKKENNKNYIASIQTTTSAGLVTPVYREVTLEELKKEIEQLNGTEPSEAFMPK